MARWFHCTLAYDGTRYGGWQVQPNTVTIQEKLEASIERVTGQKVRVLGSGRTDAGVHAEGQVASFALDNWRADASRLVPALNCRLPEDIVVRSCLDACQGFSALHLATSKKYRYIIRNARVEDPMRRKYHWHVSRPLNIHAMQEGANFMVGEMDFVAFQTLGAPRKTTVRNVTRLALSSVTSFDGIDIWLEIEANGFLYNMVRNIVGTLLEVGVGRYPPAWIRSLLKLSFRKNSGQTAPARGLSLIDVRYPDWCFDPNYIAPHLNRVEGQAPLEYNLPEPDLTEPDDVEEDHLANETIVAEDTGLDDAENQ